jgi:hypothetical protein
MPRRAHRAAQDVHRKPEAQIEDDTDDRGRDAGERAPARRDELGNADERPGRRLGEAKSI